MAAGRFLSHLSTLVGKLWSDQLKRDDDFDEKVIRRAASLAKKDTRILAIPKASRFLSCVASGKISREELRTENLEANRIMMQHYGEAERQLCEELASETGNAYLAPSPWEVAEQILLRRIGLPLEDGDLGRYAAFVNLDAIDPSDKLAVRIAELDHPRFVNEILQAIWKKCPLAAKRDRLPKSATHPVSVPLSDTEQKVLDEIKSQVPGTGITGAKICRHLADKGFPIDQSTLTRHIIPKLKASHGVENRPGVGYYIPQPFDAPTKAVRKSRKDCTSV
jgi:hypothetical protein